MLRLSRGDCAGVRYSRDDCAGAGGAEVVQSAEKVIVQRCRGKVLVQRYRCSGFAGGAEVMQGWCRGLQR